MYRILEEPFLRHQHRSENVSPYAVMRLEIGSHFEHHLKKWHESSLLLEHESGDRVQISRFRLGPQITAHYPLRKLPFCVNSISTRSDDDADDDESMMMRAATAFTWPPPAAPSSSLPPPLFPAPILSGGCHQLSRIQKVLMMYYIQGGDEGRERGRPSVLITRPSLANVPSL